METPVHTVFCTFVLGVSSLTKARPLSCNYASVLVRFTKKWFPRFGAEKSELPVLSLDFNPTQHLWQAFSDNKIAQ